MVNPRDVSCCLSIAAWSFLTAHSIDVSIIDDIQVYEDRSLGAIPRTSIYCQQNGILACFRLIPLQLPSSPIPLCLCCPMVLICR